MRQFIASIMLAVYRIMPCWMRKIAFKIRFKRENLTLKENFSFGIPLTEHCNLNCKGCDHFSPVAEVSELDTAVLSKDLSKMRELCGGGG